MNIAIIGYGGMGRYHRELIRNADHIHLTHVFDIDTERLKLAESDGCGMCATREELLNLRTVDTVLVATPNDTHFEIGAAVLKAGKHLVLEKPATIVPEDFQRLIELAKSCGKLVTVHQNRRWDSNFLTAKCIYDERPAGRVYRMENSVTAANGIPGEWRKKKAQGGGMVLDWGVHLVDQMLYMVQSPLIEVYAKCSYALCEEVDDGFYAELTFQDGFTCRVTVDTNMFIPKPRFEIYAECGTAVLPDWDNAGKMITARERYDALVSGIKAGNGLTKTMAMRSPSSVSESEVPLVKADETEFYNNLVCAAEQGAPLAVTPQSVMRTLLALSAIFESARLGQAVTTVI